MSWLRAFGLYGLQGDVGERIEDGYAADSYANAMQDDPVGQQRVFKESAGVILSLPGTLVTPRLLCNG